MMKRILSMILFFSLMTSLWSFLSVNAEEYTYGDYSYTITEGKIRITGFDSSASGAIAIPNAIGIYPVTSIGGSAFFGCGNLTSITIPDSVTSIGADAFSGCLSLKSIDVQPSNRNYASEDGVLFNKNKTNLLCCPSGKIGNYTIPDGVTSIDVRAFFLCTSLTSVAVPSGVTRIGKSSFSSCTSLTSIAIPSSVTSIGDDAFSLCTSLTSITIPHSMITIDKYTFSNCKSLTSIAIPSSVTSIGDGAFSGCTSLTSVAIPSGVTSIGDGVFSGCISLTNIHVDPGNTKYCSDDGMLFSKDKTLLHTYLGNPEGACTIPNSVTSIGNRAFSECTRLTSVTIPNSVTNIGSRAFYGCSGLTSITIPYGVTSIGGHAFYDCSELINIIIPHSVSIIDEYTFSGCTSLKNVIVPDGVTNIGRGAFFGCRKLTSITIPKSVTNIGNYAFESCRSSTDIGAPPYGGSISSDYSKLTDVYYTGREEEWNQITIGRSNKDLTSATIHYNSIGPEFENMIQMITVKNDTISVKVKNTSDTNYDSVILAIGIYRQNACLYDMKTVQIDDFISEHTEDTVQILFDSIPVGGHIKVFLWKSLTDLKPLCGCRKMTIDK